MPPEKEGPVSLGENVSCETAKVLGEIFGFFKGFLRLVNGKYINQLDREMKNTPRYNITF